MKPIAIIGSGGHGGCFLDTCRAAELNVAGFVDRTKPAGARVLDEPILGGDELLDDADFLAAHAFGIGIADPAVRRAYGEKLLAAGADLPLVAHPSCFIAPSARVGRGVLMIGFNAINHGAAIEDFVAIDWHATIGHGTRVGVACLISPGVNIAGDVTIGAEAVLGIGANVIERLSIGARTIVGAGSTVIRDIPGDVVAAGAPAKIIRRRDE